MSATVAKARWRALDRDGEDSCRLARLDGGWMLVGHARFRDAVGWAALDYVVRCDGDWRTTSCDVTGTQGGGEIALRLQRDGSNWTLNDEPQPHLQGCEDVDLGFTPATNLMPVRRLPEVGGIATRAAWLRLPGPLVDPLSQNYTRERGGYVRYEADETQFETHLEIDPNGFVLLYPGLWERDDA